MGEPYCPDQIISYTAVVSGLTTGQSVCSYSWSIANPGIDGDVVGASNQNGFYVKWRDVYKRGKVTLNVSYSSNCSSGSTAVPPVTKEYAIRSVYGQYPKMLGTQNSISFNMPYCQTSYTLPALEQMYFPEKQDMQRTEVTQYQWTLPAGMSIGGQTGTFIRSSNLSNTITFTTGCVAGTIRVRAYNGCVPEYYSNYLDIIINRTPGSIGITPSPSSLNVKCDDTNPITFTADYLSCASYLWTNIPTGWTIISGQNTRQITLKPNGLNGGSISARATLNCGTVLNSGTYNIGFDNSVAKPVFTSFDSQLCNNESATFTVNVAGGFLRTFTWTTTGGLLINGQASPLTLTYGSPQSSSSVSITAPALGGQIASVSVQADNICGISNSETITVESGRPGKLCAAVYEYSPLCVNEYSGVSICPVAGAASYIWTSNSSGLQISASYNNTASLLTTTPGTHSYTVTVNHICGAPLVRTYSISAVSGGSCGITSFALYPNPAANSFEVEMIDGLSDEEEEEDERKEKYRLKLLDKFGKEVKNQISDRRRSRVEVQNLAEGIYYLQIIHAKGVEQKQIKIAR